MSHPQLHLDIVLPVRYTCVVYWRQIMLPHMQVYGANGGPAAWNTAAITAWAQRVLVTSDAHYLILAVAAYVNPPVTLLLVPYIVLAAYGLADFVSQQYGSHPIWQRYGAPLHQKMLAYYQKALQFNAQSEIMLGFQLIVGLLFPGRAPLLLMAVWQVLRLRFWSVDAAVHHRMVSDRRAELAVLAVPCFYSLWQCSLCMKHALTG
eukprot:GHUV01038443.1.p1 GENE.GHUV01038443.1~~GHUV01038443.1.p1  ORF type:complete len:206 (+),score=41.21 GHUV01038443.1:184-801(+)